MNRESVSKSVSVYPILFLGIALIVAGVWVFLTAARMDEVRLKCH